MFVLTDLWNAQWQSSHLSQTNYSTFPFPHFNLPCCSLLLALPFTDTESRSSPPPLLQHFMFLKTPVSSFFSTFPSVFFFWTKQCQLTQSVSTSQGFKTADHPHCFTLGSSKLAHSVPIEGFNKNCCSAQLAYCNLPKVVSEMASQTFTSFYSGGNFLKQWLSWS